MERTEIITITQAQQIKDRADKKERHKRAKKLNEFRTSHCDMFDTRDFLYYSEVTGWPIEKLRRYAKYNDRNENALFHAMQFSEIDIDDLINAGM